MTGTAIGAAARGTRRTCVCSVRFAARLGVTRLVAASASGPLRIVRAEPGRVCDAVLVQTRGGLCSGDRWIVDVEVGPGASVRLRAAGATILHSGPAGCRTRLRAGRGARVSWRSRGLIAMPGAPGVAVTLIEAEPESRIAVSEMLAPCGPWPLRTRLCVRRRGGAVHEEWTELRGGGPTQLADAPVAGSAVCVGRAGPRWQGLHDGGAALVAMGTPVPGIAVARALGHSVQALDAVLGPLVESVHTVPGLRRPRHLGPPHNASRVRFAR